MFLGHPNPFSYAALFLFIPLALWFYSRFPATKATVTSCRVVIDDVVREVSEGRADFGVNNGDRRHQRGALF